MPEPNVPEISESVEKWHVFLNGISEESTYCWNPSVCEASEAHHFRTEFCFPNSHPVQNHSLWQCPACQNRKANQTQGKLKCHQNLDHLRCQSIWHQNDRSIFSYPNTVWGCVFQASNHWCFSVFIHKTFLQGFWGLGSNSTTNAHHQLNSSCNLALFRGFLFGIPWLPFCARDRLFSISLSICIMLSQLQGHARSWDSWDGTLTYEVFHREAVIWVPQFLNSQGSFSWFSEPPHQMTLKCPLNRPYTSALRRVKSQYFQPTCSTSLDFDETKLQTSSNYTTKVERFHGV